MTRDEWVKEINRLLAMEHAEEVSYDVIRIKSIKPIGREPTPLKTISDGIDFVNREYRRRTSVEL